MRRTCSATRSRVATPTFRGTRGALCRRRDAARALVGSRHAGRLLPLPAAVDGRAADEDGEPTCRRGRRADHLHVDRREHRHRAGGERRRRRSFSRPASRWFPAAHRARCLWRLGIEPHGDLPAADAGASEVVTIVAAVGCAVADGTSLDELATVAAATTDPDTTNNSATAAVPSRTRADADRRLGEPHQLLIPLHQMVPVTINYTAADSCGPVTTTLSVTSDEPVTAPLLQQGLSGLTSPDWQVRRRAPRAAARRAIAAGRWARLHDFHHCDATPRVARPRRA